MRTRIGTQVIAGVGGITFLTIGLMAVAILRSHEQQFIAERTRSADQLGETILSSTHDDMLENRREHLRRQIDAIGGRSGIERVRLFNKEGRVVFSSSSDEVGTTLDRGAEGCRACHVGGRPVERLAIHERARIFPGSGGKRVLGIIHPIDNEAACSTASCHAHPRDARILGVLDVQVSLAEVDRELAASRRGMVALALLTILASGALLGWLIHRLVVVPSRALLEGTRRVAEGDLTTSIAIPASHELGDVARAFNAMTQRLVEAQRELTQADKLASVGRLAAGVAHEINNPLTGVLTYASCLSKRAGDDTEMQRDLDVIVRETKRCRAIVKELLDFARRTPPDRTAVDLNVVIRRSVSIVMNQLALSHVALTLDLDDTLPTIPADANQIQQVVTNLVLNAADAVGGSGGSIQVSSRRAELQPAGPADNGVGDTPASRPCLEIAVEDDGQGIAPTDLPRVFEPFFSTKGTRGTGLGLAVTWGIIEGHGGTIDVRSEQGQGARFTVRLPLVPPVGRVLYGHSAVLEHDHVRGASHAAS